MNSLGFSEGSIINIQAKLSMGKFNLNDKEGVKECQDFLEEKLENIDSYVQGLSTTIDDFRNFHNPHKKKELLKIEKPLKQALGIIKDSLERDGISIYESYESQQVCKMADGEIMQVFLNIFKNAQDNFRENRHKNPIIMIHTRDISDAIMIEIKDNGGGIPQNIMDKIFDPYFSTKDSKNGTGLGLFMSKTIIEEHHHGKIMVKNRQEGVIFSITLSSATLPPDQV